MSNTYHYTEDSYEQTVLDLFREMDYDVLHGPDVDAETGRDLTDATIPGKLHEAMLRINGAEKVAAVDEAIRKVHELFSQPLVQANVQLTDWLQNGLDVTFKTSEGSLRSDHVRILDIENPTNNSFQVVNQWTVVNGQARSYQLRGRLSAIAKLYATSATTFHCRSDACDQRYGRHTGRHHHRTARPLYGMEDYRRLL